MSESEPWATFSDPDFVFVFDYPAIAPSGAAVLVGRIPHPGGEAVHLATADTREVYFELDRRVSVSAEAANDALAADVSSRFPKAWFGRAEPTEICGLPALSVHFKFADRVRWAIFTVSHEPNYRLILDPRSPTNLQILGSLTLRR